MMIKNAELGAGERPDEHHPSTGKRLASSPRARARRWRTARWFSIACGVFLHGAAHGFAAVSLTHAEAMRVGRKIWQNECGGTIAGLTSWNGGENFASLGIGHFIWYPKQVRGPFDESFPPFVAFAKKRGAKIPAVANRNGDASCPWTSRAEFLAAQSSAAMLELRAFLVATIDLQADFLVTRLQAALPKMLAAAAPNDRATIAQNFQRVASSAHGCYALIDYVNFKGEGVLATEQYRGRGWGLRQVLQEMRSAPADGSATSQFAAAAARVLRERVKNSPPERKENRWLPGWLNRVAIYR